MITVLLEKIIQILEGWIQSFSSHAQHVEDKLDSIDSTASDIETNTDPIPDIRDNTAAIITPIQNIKSNTDSIATSSQTSANNTTAILNNVGTLSTNTGRAAAFAEDCANNTLDIKDKVVTIASDTTQIRTNTDSIALENSKIYDGIKWLLSDKYIDSTESGDSPFTFNTDVVDDLIACNIGIEGTQAGSGDPAPDNVRSITGISDINISVNGSTAQISLGQDVYNGIIDPISGKLIIYSKYMILSDKTWNYNGQYGFMYTSTIADMRATPNTDIAPFLNSDCYKAGTGQQTGSGAVNNTIAVSSKTLRIRDERYTDPTAFTSAMGNTQIVYPLDVPIEVQLTASQIATIKGDNTISTDSNGDIEVTFKESIKNYLDKLDNA